MKLKVSPSHVAILVPSVRKAANYLRHFDYEIGEEEAFDETREIYVQGNDRNSLLLMEPAGPGSYKSALKKRGPGIHHFAIDVLNLEKYLNSISNSGWLLHLNSLTTIKNNRTVYLARPGFPALIEVQEKKTFSNGPLFIKKVSLDLEATHIKRLASIGLERIVTRSNKNPTLNINNKSIIIENLY
jgi:hypothetical protein